MAVKIFIDLNGNLSISIENDTQFENDLKPFSIVTVISFSFKPIEFKIEKEKCLSDGKRENIRASVVVGFDICC